MNKDVTFQEWLKLKPGQRRSIYELWNRYNGEGEQIVKAACNVLRTQLKRHKDIVGVHYGVYHGGDWVISVTLRVGHALKIPKIFCGIPVARLYDGLSDTLKHKLRSQYRNDVEQFVEGERAIFGKYFDFTISPHGKTWLVEFVKKNAAK